MNRILIPCLLKSSRNPEPQSANMTGAPWTLAVSWILIVSLSRCRTISGVTAPGHLFPLSEHKPVRYLGNKNDDGKCDHRKAEQRIDFQEQGYEQVFNVPEPVRIEFLYEQ